MPGDPSGQDDLDAHPNNHPLPEDVFCDVKDLDKSPSLSSQAMNMINHRIPEKLFKDDFGTSVEAVFALNPECEAVIFIHGYGGHPIDSWIDFQELLPRSPACSGHDLYFYGYDSRASDVMAEACAFREFLASLLDHTDQYMAQCTTSLSPERWANFTYKRALIVAHSLGAVIARQALLDGTRDQDAWPQRCQLLLFAPAHKGTKGVDIGLDFANSIPFLQYVVPFFLFGSPAVNDLKADSPLLANLENDVKRFTSNGANPHLNARMVVIASGEKIVNNSRFANDPSPVVIKGTTHTNICQPNASRLEPLRHLEECLM